MRRTLYTLSCLILAATLSAQLHINEFSAANLNGFTDSFGKTEDWIELYNASNEVLDISGWYLSDKEHKPQKWPIPPGTFIEPGGHLVIYASGRDLVTEDREYHTNFKLTQTKENEVVQLADPNGVVQEVFPVAITLVEHARCRVLDGSADWAITTEPTPGATNDNSPQIKRYTVAPTIEVPAGFYPGQLTVAITNNEEHSVIRYTTDGTNPTGEARVYNGPLTITHTQVLKAQAFSEDNDILPGKMAFSTYFIDEPEYTLPVFSVAADQLLDLAGGIGEIIPIGSLEYFTADGELETTSFGSLNRHGQDSWVLDHRSLDWVSRDEMGYSKAVATTLFNHTKRDEYQKFMFRNSGDDNYPAINTNAHQGSTHIRDEYVQTLARMGGMKLDTRSVERVVVYLNGIYWGVYGMRDRPVDHDYTKYYYDQDKYNLQYLTTWGTTEVQYGGQQALDSWVALRDFILDNDMGIPENYQIAEDSLNMVSLIDYFLVNSNVVASDWLNYNTGWWRGMNPEGDHKKWGYILWDLDATFDYYINYTDIPNTSPSALVCDIEQISLEIDTFFVNQGDGMDTIDVPTCATLAAPDFPYLPTDSILQLVMNNDPYCCNTEFDIICQDLYSDFQNGNGPSPGPDLENIHGNVGKHEKILLKLIDESTEFRHLYFGRYADLMNTVFSCENMNSTLDSMLLTIEPEMPGQIQRWGGSMTEWQQNVEALREFINERCARLADNLPECYPGLHGPYPVTLMTEPAGVGEIDFNTLDIESFPWTGDYYGNVHNKIKAKAHDEFADQWAFSHWETRMGSVVSPDQSSRRATLSLTGPDTLVAVFYDVVSTDNFSSRYNIELFPNPTSGTLNLNYSLERAATVSVELYTPLGQPVTTFPAASGRQVGGPHQSRLQLPPTLPAGLYLIKLTIDGEQRMFRVNYIR